MINPSAPLPAPPPLPSQKRARLLLILLFLAVTLLVGALLAALLLPRKTAPHEVSVTQFMQLINNEAFLSIDVSEDGTVEGTPKPVLGTPPGSPPSDKVLARFPPSAVTGSGFYALQTAAASHDVQVKYKQSGSLTGLFHRLTRLL